MLHLFLQQITTKYNKSQPNTPTLVSWVGIYCSIYYSTRIVGNTIDIICIVLNIHD